MAQTPKTAKKSTASHSANPKGVNVAKKTSPKKSKPSKRTAKKSAKKSPKKPARLTVPLRSNTRLTGGPRPIGTIKKMGVEQTWCFIFHVNETRKKHWTDADITAQMHRAFPGRESLVFENVTGVRRKLNRGGFEIALGKLSIKQFQSRRWDESGNEIAFGKQKFTAPNADAKPAKKTTPKKPAKKPAKKRPVKK